MSNGAATKSDTPLASQGQSPNGGESSSQPSPKTYTEQDIINERKRQAGLNKTIADLQAKLANTESTWKSQLESKEDELKAIAEERAGYLKDLQDIASGDPNQFNVVQRTKDLGERERKLKAEIKANEERIKKAEAFERKELVGTIAADYKDADVNKLQRLCDKAKVTSEEDIREIADTLGWERKQGDGEPATTTAKVTPVKPDSGKTSGGGANLDGLSSKDLLRKAYAQK